MLSCQVITTKEVMVFGQCCVQAILQHLFQAVQATLLTYWSKKKQNNKQNN